jgi:hypothetical protein
MKHFGVVRACAWGWRWLRAIVWIAVCPVDPMGCPPAHLRPPSAASGRCAETVRSEGVLQTGWYGSVRSGTGDATAADFSASVSHVLVRERTH